MGKSEIIYNYDERNNFYKARTGTGRIWRLVILWDDFSLEQVTVALKFFSAVRNTVLWDTRQFLCSVP